MWSRFLNNTNPKIVVLVIMALVAIVITALALTFSFYDHIFGKKK